MSAEALVSDARAAHDRCAYADAERLALRAAEAAERENDSAVLYSARWTAARAMQDQGRHGRAVRVFRLALDVAERAPELEVRRPRVYHDLHGACVLSGARSAAGVYFRRAEAGYNPEDPRRIRLLADRAWALIEVGEPAAGLRIIDTLRDVAPEQAGVPTIAGHRALALALIGRTDEAVRAARSLAVELDEQGACGAAWPWYCVGNALYLAGGPIREARTAVGRARRLAASFGEERTRAQASALLQRIGQV